MKKDLLTETLKMQRLAGIINDEGKNTTLNENTEMPAVEEPIAKPAEIYYQADYYDKQGGHGSMEGSSPDFDSELRKAIELFHRERKAGELGKSTGYIGVSGSGEKFAILYLDQDYYKNMDEKDFKDRGAYETWMKMAKKVLETGKPQKGAFPHENEQPISESQEIPDFRTESFKEFEQWWKTQPAGTIVYRVRTFNGDGNKVGVEYSTNEDDISDMQAISRGYFTETHKLTKKNTEASTANSTLEESHETKSFSFKVKHDKGSTTIKTTASSLEAAKKKIMDAEGCPESALTHIG